MSVFIPFPPPPFRTRAEQDCDKAMWQNVATQVYFKWCKGCKRFVRLRSFSENLEASKCNRCRERNRKSYLVKRGANGEEEVQVPAPQRPRAESKSKARPRAQSVAEKAAKQHAASSSLSSSFGFGNAGLYGASDGGGDGGDRPRALSMSALTSSLRGVAVISDIDDYDDPWAMHARRRRRRTSDDDNFDDDDDFDDDDEEEGDEDDLNADAGYECGVHLVGAPDDDTLSSARAVVDFMSFGNTAQPASAGDDGLASQAPSAGLPLSCFAPPAAAPLASSFGNSSAVGSPFGNAGLEGLHPEAGGLPSALAGALRMGDDATSTEPRLAAVPSTTMLSTLAAVSLAEDASGAGADPETPAEAPTAVRTSGGGGSESGSGGRDPLAAPGSKSFRGTLYELASIHSRIVALEETARRVGPLEQWLVAERAQAQRLRAQHGALSEALGAAEALAGARAAENTALRAECAALRVAAAARVEDEAAYRAQLAAAEKAFARAVTANPAHRASQALQVSASPRGGGGGGGGGGEPHEHATRFRGAKRRSETIDFSGLPGFRGGGASASASPFSSSMSSSSPSSSSLAQPRAALSMPTAKGCADDKEREAVVAMLLVTDGPKRPRAVSMCE